MSSEIELVDETGYGNSNDVVHVHLHHSHQTNGGCCSRAPGVVSPRYNVIKKHDDVESGDMAFCRICFEGSGERDDDLISPCLCKGTQQFVHRACLDHWRSVKEGFAFSHCTTCKAEFHLKVVKLKAMSWPRIKFRLFVARDLILVFLALQVVIALIGCVAYAFDKDKTLGNSYRVTMDALLSTKPLPFYYCIGILLLCVGIGFIGLLIHCATCSNDPRVAGCQNLCLGCGLLDCFPTAMEIWAVFGVFFVILFFFLGIAYSLFAATVAVQRIVQNHYHILTKRELTQEFVVEDLNGCYTPPELAPEHVERLSLLKLI